MVATFLFAGDHSMSMQPTKTENHFMHTLIFLDLFLDFNFCLGILREFYLDEVEIRVYVRQW